MRIKVGLRFGAAPIRATTLDLEDAAAFEPTGFIAHPYWPEREKVISIRKKSGVDRPMLSDARRPQVLQQYLESIQSNLETFRKLEERAERPFYTLRDVVSQTDGHDPDEIVVAAHELYGCMAQAAALASSAIRVAKPESLRSVLTVSDFVTGKTEKDGAWERYVTVKTGTGAKLSNQRGHRSNDFIENFTARGLLRFSTDVIDKPDKLKRFLEFAGREIGVGASRKMGWGRFVVSEWEPLESKA